MARIPVNRLFVDSTGRHLLVHHKKDCQAAYCVIHNPSPHHMGEWPLLWREDRGFFERICPHGIGHPDPDSLRYMESLGLDVSVHGCDGCCAG